jgi:hypothetical protein
MHPPASSKQASVPLPQSSLWLRWLPFLMLLLAAVLVLLVWDHFPDHWAVHWGGMGGLTVGPAKRLSTSSSPLALASSCVGSLRE